MKKFTIVVAEDDVAALLDGLDRALDAASEAQSLDEDAERVLWAVEEQFRRQSG